MIDGKERFLYRYMVATPLRTVFDAIESRVTRKDFGTAVRDALERGLVDQCIVDGASRGWDARRH